MLSAHEKLRSFKRDLRSMGLSHAQIHEIIPAAPTRRRAGQTPAASVS